MVVGDPRPGPRVEGRGVTSARVVPALPSSRAERAAQTPSWPRCRGIDEAPPEASMPIPIGRVELAGLVDRDPPEPSHHER